MNWTMEVLTSPDARWEQGSRVAADLDDRYGRCVRSRNERALARFPQTAIEHQVRERLR